jgi:hypothetical protein
MASRIMEFLMRWGEVHDLSREELKTRMGTYNLWRKPEQPFELEAQSHVDPAGGKNLLSNSHLYSSAGPE